MRDYDSLANCIRALSMDAVERAQSGHPGMPMGMAAAAAVLFADFLKFDPQHPDWPDRDRFVLSAGHGSMLLYSLLHLCGYPQTTLEQIKNFRQWGSSTPGHPEYGIAPGVETTTGPLGQGFANAVGMALAERIVGSATVKIPANTASAKPRPAAKAKLSPSNSRTISASGDSTATPAAPSNSSARRDSESVIGANAPHHFLVILLFLASGQCLEGRAI